MNDQRLKQHIIDTIEEQQLKLGYLDETVRLYYPLSSLNRFLQVDVSVECMKEYLSLFTQYAEKEFGKIDITNQGDRFCIAIPPTGARYIHDKLKENTFLTELIQCVKMHKNTWEEVLEIFTKYSNCVHVEQMSNGEFDYLVYFEDGNPDNYRYCISVEMSHVTYHRYTPEDYEEFGF